MTINVDDVATDADLEVYTVGRSNLQDIITDEWLDEVTGLKSAKNARQQALDEILAMLARRRPPILDSYLTDVTELKRAVCFGALALLYRAAITHEDSPNVAKAKLYTQMFKDEKESLEPTLYRGVVAASSLNVRVSRG